MSLKPINRVTDFLQNLLRERIPKGGIVVDATMGNGYDTVFLWEQVGILGKVYAFDIQQESIEKTKQSLKERKIPIDTTNIKLIHDGHENMEKYIIESIDAAMFNLGYLPGGVTKEIVTKPNTTIKALSIALSLLKKGGVVSLIIYYGHLGGTEEKEAVLTFVKKLESSKFTVLKCSYMNHHNNPPVILLIEKR